MCCLRGEMCWESQYCFEYGRGKSIKSIGLGFLGTFFCPFCTVVCMHLVSISLCLSHTKHNFETEVLLYCGCLEASIITNLFCSTQWLTHSTIPEGAESFSYATVCLMTLPHLFPRRLILGRHHRLIPLKQNNTISHKLCGLIRINHMRSVWLYHTVEANLSML